MQRRHRPSLQQVEHPNSMCLFPTAAGSLSRNWHLHFECFIVFREEKIFDANKDLIFQNPQTKPSPPSSLQYQAATLDWHVTDRSLALV